MDIILTPPPSRPARVFPPSLPPVGSAREQLAALPQKAAAASALPAQAAAAQTEAAPHEEVRFQQTQKAAQLFKDFYAVSDVVFTIFKDTTGKYITRFTSLRDGQVTYIPEPDLVKHLYSRGEKTISTVELEA